jgi:hypothetical protein
MRFFRHAGIYLVRCSQPRLNPETGSTASRRPTPRSGRRTCREDHAPSHRPQMSSGRLFLDRVGRHHCPSPLHRHTQTNMVFLNAPRGHDISTLQTGRHFYFALTVRRISLPSIRRLDYTTVSWSPITQTRFGTAFGASAQSREWRWFKSAQVLKGQPTRKSGLFCFGRKDGNE